MYLHRAVYRTLVNDKYLQTVFTLHCIQSGQVEVGVDHKRISENDDSNIKGHGYNENSFSKKLQHTLQNDSVVSLKSRKIL
jgi:hypothetical protein